MLLTDWMMPGIDGPELCRRVRARAERPLHLHRADHPLGQPEQVLEGMGAGADDYLIKPVDPFAVQTRLVAAERVTALHRQLVEFRAQLEQANIELLGRSLTDALTASATAAAWRRTWRAPTPGRCGSVAATAWRCSTSTTSSSTTTTTGTWPGTRPCARSPAASTSVPGRREPLPLRR